MTKKTLVYLRSIGLASDEAEAVLESVPAILDTEDEIIMSNIELVISYGYPREDIATLIAINPSFLILSGDSLRASLETLGDVEEDLKKDPFLI